MKLIKYKNNPILKPNSKNYWENLCVLNPAVVYDEDLKKFVMLYRAAGNDVHHKICFGLAYSDDGFNFTRYSNEPTLNPDIDDCDGGCIEDPRAVKIDDYYYITYAARAFCPGRYWLPTYKEERAKWFEPQKETVPAFYRINHTVTYLAITKDFKRFRRLGRITDSRVDDRDVVIFPRRINGKFVRINRPNIDGTQFMNISFSDDLLEWDNEELFFKGTEKWEYLKVGASCPPIETDKGWLFIYHGVSKDDMRYRVGIMLLDLNDPRRIIGRTKNFVMEPDVDYELNGLYDGCVFPTGAVIKDETLFVYYGCGDKFVSVATQNINLVLDSLLKGNC